LTGPGIAVGEVNDRITVEHRVLGPVPVPDSDKVRSYLVVPRRFASEFTTELGAILRTASVKETAVREVRVRMDPRDM
jgi:hypothetical protein